MENEGSSGRPDGPSELPGPAQARDALDALNADGARLAERMVTPWWYHLVLGLIVASFAASQALPGSAPIVVVALGIIVLPILTTTYSRRYGVSTSQPAGPLSRRLLLFALGVLVLAMAASLVIKLTDISPWWTLLSAFVAFTATVILGRRFDDALRSELAQAADGHE